VKVQLPCPAAKVQCGMAHTLCLLENGEVYGWGYGEKGALGTGEFKSRARPARVQIEGRVKQISAGAMHSAFLTNSGELFMCGANDNG
jgi:alpha-tubulin suppressor-like RCC1 family protein